MANYQGGRNSYKNQPVKWKDISIKFLEDSYVDEAEQVIKELMEKRFSVNRETLTTSQLRNLLSLTSHIYTEIQVQPFDNVMDRIAYLRVQFVYQSGRNAAVKKLVELADILNLLGKIQDNKDKREMIRFCRYMEALVAYFKFYGGRD